MDLSETAPDNGEENLNAAEDTQSGNNGEVARGSQEPNPFWSDRAVEEFRLQQARPLQLSEFDDRQLEPEYGSEAGRSVGYVSALAPSVRVDSPAPVQRGESSSEARHSGAVSSAPSITSRSRSPTREDTPGVRELLVSLGNAVGPCGGAEKYSEATVGC